MRFDWKLQIIVFWSSFLAVSFYALLSGFSSESGLTDEGTSYLLYETAFLTLTIILISSLLWAYLQSSKLSESILLAENQVLSRAGASLDSSDLEWSEEVEESISRAIDDKEIHSLLRKRELLRECRKKLWKKMLSPVLQLVFLITISSAAIPSSGWFLQSHADINTTAAIEVIGGSFVAVLFLIATLALLRPRLEES